MLIKGCNEILEYDHDFRLVVDVLMMMLGRQNVVIKFVVVFGKVQFNTD